MFKRILIPIDFSVHSSWVLHCIPNLKNAGIEEVILVHVIDPTEAAYWANMDEAITERKREAEQKMNEIISETLPPREGIEGTCMTEVGFPQQVILSIAERENVSLVVMGSHGHSFLECALLGSVTNAVIRKTRVPVLITKIQLTGEKGEERPVCLGMRNIFRKILYPTDFSDQSLAVLDVIRHLDKALVDEVVIAHVQDTRKLLPHLKHRMEEFNETDSQRLEKMQSQLEELGHTVKTVLREGVPFVEIGKIAEEEDVSLIMISSQGKSAIREALMGSVSESVAREHVRPVMVFPTAEK